MVPVFISAKKKRQTSLKVSFQHLGIRLSSLSQVGDDKNIPMLVGSASIRQLRCHHNIIKARLGPSMHSCALPGVPFDTLRPQ